MKKQRPRLTKLCPCCRKRPKRASHAYCTRCHASNMRRWRKTHPLTDEQRLKDNCRSIAGIHKRLGKLVLKPCQCGSRRVEMHHTDYTKPLEVLWMCRTCHLKHHASFSL